jgi:alanine racemase
MLSYIQLSRSNLLSNIQTFRKLIPENAKLVAVIKGNAYGHGQNEIAQLAETYVDYFQVDDLEELRLLRKVSTKPTFVFGYVPVEDLEELVALKGTPGIYDIERARALNILGQEKKQKIEVQIKIDALLGRQGLLLDQIPVLCKQLKKLTNLDVAGIYSHFSNIEDTESLDHAFAQLEYFDQAVKVFEQHGFTQLQKHFSATSGILMSRDLTHTFDLYRLGLGMYGLWPSENLRIKFEDAVKLKPVLSWVTHVAQVKHVPENFPIGYGMTYITKTPLDVAIIPQGYSDGYDRGLSNVGQVEMNGKLFPVIGRIAMNMVSVDVTGSSVQVGDEVNLIGKLITPETIAEQLQTINYEIVARISPLLPRIIS